MEQMERNMSVQHDIISFVAKAGKIAEHELDGTTNIYDSSIVSSLVIMEMIVFIERRYNVVIAPEKMIEENFKDIRTIAGFVDGLLNAA
jgi:acyl carrier protein